MYQCSLGNNGRHDLEHRHHFLSSCLGRQAGDKTDQCTLRYKHMFHSHILHFQSSCQDRQAQPYTRGNHTIMSRTATQHFYKCAHSNARPMFMLTELMLYLRNLNLMKYKVKVHEIKYRPRNPVVNLNAPVRNLKPWFLSSYVTIEVEEQLRARNRECDLFWILVWDWDFSKRRDSGIEEQGSGFIGRGVLRFAGLCGGYFNDVSTVVVQQCSHA